MTEPRILQVIDSLELGGAENVAVQLANALSERVEISGICITRRMGPLEKKISKAVNVHFLARTRTLDFFAAWRMRKIIKAKGYNILHAHSSSIFFCLFVGLFIPSVIIWHDHFGRVEVQARPKHKILRWFKARIQHIYAVNDHLRTWALHFLRFPPNKVSYLANYVEEPLAGKNWCDLPGQKDKRYLCVANFRPQKDHFTLIKAFDLVIEKDPEARLLLVGKNFEDDYGREVLELVSNRDHILYLGEVHELGNLFEACSVGVLSSISEGLPLVLLEYGLKGLAIVSTNVGDCPKASPENYPTVDPQNPEALAQALIEVISPKQLSTRQRECREHVQRHFKKEPVLQTLLAKYRELLNHCH